MVLPAFGSGCTTGGGHGESVNGICGERWCMDQDAGRVLEIAEPGNETSTPISRLVPELIHQHLLFNQINPVT